MEAGLELLRARDMEINLALQNQHQVIEDTGASLAITGGKRDFFHQIPMKRLLHLS